MAKRFKVQGRAGIYYRMADRVGFKGQERVYYVVYKKDGKMVEAKAGRQYADQMTAAKASLFRGNLIEGREVSREEQRKADKAVQEESKGRYTIDRLWTEYKASRKPGKGFITDRSRYKQYLKPLFANLEPHEIMPLDVERLKRRLLKKKAPQTVKHVLNLLTWIVNYGVKNGLCAALPFRIKKPEVHNSKTEDLTPTQLKKLLKAIEAHPHEQAGKMMLMALYSGVRRGEMFKLQWSHVDFERGFIELVDPKGGKPQKIPMNEPTRELLDGIKRTKGSPFVFPGRGGRQLQNLRQPLNEIKKNAGLPADFRPLHGLRHVFASQLASSGQVDMYTLQKLLTHKTPVMTQRYAHLRDSTLRNASELAGNLILESLSKQKRVVNLKGGDE